MDFLTNIFPTAICVTFTCDYYHLIPAVHQKFRLCIMIFSREFFIENSDFQKYRSWIKKEPLLFWPLLPQMLTVQTYPATSPHSLSKSIESGFGLFCGKSNTEKEANNMVFLCDCTNILLYTIF